VTSTKVLERVYAKAEVEHLRDATERAIAGDARNFTQIGTICRGAQKRLKAL